MSLSVSQFFYIFLKIKDSQNLSKCKLLLKKLWIARTLRKPLRLFYLLFQLVLLSEKLLCLFFQVLKKTKQTKVSQKRTLKGISNKCIKRNVYQQTPIGAYTSISEMSPHCPIHRQLYCLARSLLANWMQDFTSSENSPTSVNLDLY